MPVPHADKNTAKLFRTAMKELSASLSDEEAGVLRGFAEVVGSGSATPAHTVQGLHVAGGLAARADLSALTVALYEDLLRRDSSDAAVFHNLGNHLAKLSRPDEAIEAYTQAVARDPGLSGSYLNRGRLLEASGKTGEALEDFLQVARTGIDVEGFHEFLAVRYIREHGFMAFFRLSSDESLPQGHGLPVLRALSRALSNVKSFGGWYLYPMRQASVPGGLDRTMTDLLVGAGIADILRESPYAMMIGHLQSTRSPDGEYKVGEAGEELQEAFWYRPADWSPNAPDPDRAEHLARLAGLYPLAEAREELDMAWAAHYVSGAIAQSALYGGRRDWPTDVLRLSVRCEIGEDSWYPLPAAVAELEAWLAEAFPGSFGAENPLGWFASWHFRYAATELMAIRQQRTAPSPPDLNLLDGEGNPIMQDGEWVKGSLGRSLAAEAWWTAQPVFREWVINAFLLGSLVDYPMAAGYARAFNVLVAMELWSDVEPAEWRAARAKIEQAYYTPNSTVDLSVYAPTPGLYLDYYVYEIVEDTIVRASVAGDRATLVEAPVDVLAGDLELLLDAHRHKNIAADGFDPRVDQLLLGDLADLPDAEFVVITSFGYLRNVPFHALPSMIEAIDAHNVKAVAYLPSTSLLFALDKPRERPATPRCLFVGHDEHEEIDVEGELACVEGTFERVTSLLGRKATLGEVLRQLGRHDVVHFACHGDMDPHIAAGYLELAGERLYPWHLLRGASSPASVVLNACLTSTTEVFEPTSDEAFGLQNAFLVSGARHVIGGLWEVSEWSAGRFARAFYEHWAADLSASPAASVLNAQRALRAETGDPFLWAPHAFFGDWR